MYDVCVKYLLSVKRSDARCVVCTTFYGRHVHGMGSAYARLLRFGVMFACSSLAYLPHPCVLFGCSVFQYKGYHPFDPTSDSTDEEIVEAVITSDPDWDGLEPRVAHLIQKMLSKNPSDRPSAREILQNPWLQVANKS